MERERGEREEIHGKRMGNGNGEEGERWEKREREGGGRLV